MVGQQMLFVLLPVVVRVLVRVDDYEHEVPHRMVFGLALVVDLHAML